MEKPWNPLADLFEEKLRAGYSHVAQGEQDIGMGYVEHLHVLCFLRQKGNVIARKRSRCSSGGLMLAGTDISWHEFPNEKALRDWALHEQKVPIRNRVDLKVALERLRGK